MTYTLLTKLLKETVKSQYDKYNNMSSSAAEENSDSLDSLLFQLNSDWTPRTFEVLNNGIYSVIERTDSQGQFHVPEIYTMQVIDGLAILMEEDDSDDEYLYTVANSDCIKNLLDINVSIDIEE